MVRILAYLPGWARPTRLAGSVVGWGEIDDVSGASAARAVAAYASGEYAGAVVTPLDAAARPTYGLVRALVHRRPSAPIVLLVSDKLDRSVAAALGPAIRAGARSVVIHEPGLRDALQSAFLATSHIGCWRDSLLPLLQLVPHPARRIVQQCWADPHGSQRVAQLALALAVHRRTLANWCVASHVPPPDVLIDWSRVAVLAARLATEDTTLDHVAIDLGFGNAGTLRAAARRCGLRLRDLRSSANDGAIPLAVESALRMALRREDDEGVP